MASREYKIGKQAAAGMKRHITFTVPCILKIITKPEVLHSAVLVWQYTRTRMYS